MPKYLKHNEINRKKLLFKVESFFQLHVFVYDF